MRHLVKKNRPGAHVIVKIFRSIRYDLRLFQIPKILLEQATGAIPDALAEEDDLLRGVDCLGIGGGSSAIDYSRCAGAVGLPALS